MGKWIRFFTVLLVLAFLPAAASAHPVPEPGRKGSVTVSMQFDGEAVPGGELTLYRVGEVSEDDGNYTFVPTGEFVRWGSDFGTLASAEQTAQTAHSLRYFALRNGITGTTKGIGTDGKVTFSNLEQGLYLLVQTRAASGYSKVSPFLVTVPYLDDGVYIYEVDADTKMELEKEPKPTAPPSTPHTGGKLPQTGQLNWPVPVLAILGMTLFTVGWVLRFRKRHGNAG